MSARADTPMLSLLLIANPGVDVADLVRDLYNDTLEMQTGTGFDSVDIAAIVVAVWSGQISDEPPRVAWRLSVFFDPTEIEPTEGVVSFAQEVIDEILNLARDPKTGVLAVMKLADPVQLHGHTELYREVYSIEMALREVVSYIFAAEFPDNLIDGLAKTLVKPASTENLPQDPQLIKFGENRFFYVLFDKYAILNNTPEVKASHIHDALKGATNLDEVRNALDLRPIKEQRHADFLASLQTLMDPLEKVRNAVAHNRTVLKEVRENFHKAVEKLREEIDEFWKREDEHLGGSDSP